MCWGNYNIHTCTNACDYMILRAFISQYKSQISTSVAPNNGKVGENSRIAPRFVPSRRSAFCFAINDGKFCAIFEHRMTNASYAVGNYNGCKARTSIKRISTNICHTVRNYNGCKARTSVKRLNTNICHAVGNRDACKACATIERTTTNICHAVGDNCIFTTHNKSIGRLFNNTIPFRIIY